MFIGLCRVCQGVHAQTDKAETGPILLDTALKHVDANARSVNAPHKRASHGPGRKGITVRLRNKRATPLNKVSTHKQDATPKPK